MTTAPRWNPALALLGLVLASGCAQPGPLSTRGPRFGAMKATVSQLEFERQALRRDLASREQEVRRLEDRLAQSEASNGDLAARIDDLKALVAQGGGSVEGPGFGAGDRLGADDGPGRITPARRGSRPPRKIPVTQIPGSFEVTPYPEPDAPADGSSARDDDYDAYGDFGPQSSRQDAAPWLPVARDDGSPRLKIR